VSKDNGKEKLAYIGQRPKEMEEDCIGKEDPN
jgi:hypothetical protein